jgi:hypothetical protein
MNNANNNKGGNTVITGSALGSIRANLKKSLGQGNNNKQSNNRSNPQDQM